MQLKQNKTCKKGQTEEYNYNKYGSSIWDKDRYTYDVTIEQTKTSGFRLTFDLDFDL